MTKVLSYGGGLDSFAMLVAKVLDGEKPDIVTFIDVADVEHRDPGEWPSTYRHIDEVVRPFCEEHGIEFVAIDSTRYPVRDARSLFAWLWAREQIPVAGPDRICTTIAKVERFERWLDDRFPGQEVEVWIGFEAGEEKRVAKDPNAGAPRGATGLRERAVSGPVSRQVALVLHNAFRWLGAVVWAMTHAQRRNRFPLMELELCRCRCEQLVRETGYPIPRKSACVFCPYASRGDWRALASQLPAVFEHVVELEERKPLTQKNGRKLSIMAYSSKKQMGTPLPVYITRPGRKPKVVPCKVCGAAQRATKATGCDYLEDPRELP